jgi:hypothetical protein
MLRRVPRRRATQLTKVTAPAAVIALISSLACSHAAAAAPTGAGAMSHITVASDARRGDAPTVARSQRVVRASVDEVEEAAPSILVASRRLYRGISTLIVKAVVVTADDGPTSARLEARPAAAGPLGAWQQISEEVVAPVENVQLDDSVTQYEALFAVPDSFAATSGAWEVRVESGGGYSSTVTVTVLDAATPGSYEYDYGLSLKQQRYAFCTMIGNAIALSTGPKVHPLYGFAAAVAGETYKELECEDDFQAQRLFDRFAMAGLFAGVSTFRGGDYAAWFATVINSVDQLSVDLDASLVDVNEYWRSVAKDVWNNWILDAQAVLHPLLELCMSGPVTSVFDCHDIALSIHQLGLRLRV